MAKTPIPRPDRIRRIHGTFSWLDHRLKRDGHLEKLSRDELALYTFLVLVADHNGISFYRLEKICQFLDYMEWPDFHQARKGLIAADLIAFQPFGPNQANGFYQVLSLDKEKQEKPA